MRKSLLYKLGVLVPAFVWLFIQFSMSGLFTSTSEGAIPVELCTSSGVQQIYLDPETGEPIESSSSSESCEWCQSFGVVTDTAARGDVEWRAVERSFAYRLALAPAPHKSLRPAADYHSRAPPVL